MVDPLLHAYVPLVLWTGLGLLLVPWLPESLPRLLGRGLYWVGVPLQIFTLAHQGNFSEQITLVPAIALWNLLVGLLLASMALWLLDRRSSRAKALTLPAEPSPVVATGALGEAESEACPTVPDISPTFWNHGPRRGAFVVSSIIGNTGFVGLAVVPTFIADPYQGWVVLYSVVNNVLGTYGVGVLLASFYGRFPEAEQGRSPSLLPRSLNRVRDLLGIPANHAPCLMAKVISPWLTILRDVLTVPSLWAFGVGFLSRSWAFAEGIEMGLRASLWVVIPAALLLMGIRLRQIKGWQGLRLGAIPTMIKTVGLPLAIGGTTLLLHLPAQPRLAMVLMAGMPAAFAGLILAEEYDLDRELIASSIVVSTTALFVTLPLWLFLFG